MAIGANSYGSADGVAAYVRGLTAAASFSVSTIPTLAQVESWLDEVSAIANTGMKAAGFTIPLTQADAVLALRGMINQYVAQLAELSRGQGRFTSERAQNSSLSPMGTIRKELLDFINTNADGWEALGAARAASERNEIGFRDSDEAGDPTFPIFQRNAFGNSFTDWDNQ
jgi:hypothetical protein